MNIVLDTNCLLMSLSRRSAYYPVWRDFVDGKYTLCITNEILAEYEEILTQKVGPEIASNVITAILDLPNTKMVQVYYHLRLITADPDDDKFKLLEITICFWVSIYQKPFFQELTISIIGQ